MFDIIDSASVIMGVSERRIEISAYNVANISTTGYKRKIPFQLLLTDGAILDKQLPVLDHSDVSQGKLTPTDNPLDLAISGAGFFELRDVQSRIYSRQGQFRLDAEGRMVTADGLVLQDADGGDLVLDHGRVTIADDGTVLDGERPIARIAVKLPANGNAENVVDGVRLSGPTGAMVDAPAAEIRQGMIEASNVTLGDEMVAIMSAMRQAESGSRLVQVYDELMGRALTVLGQGGR